MSNRGQGAGGTSRRSAATASVARLDASVKQRRDGLQKRHAILDASARAISEHGFHGMSLRDLAAATGQSLANFYNYYDSKEAVLFEIQRGAFEAMIEATEEAVARAKTAEGRLYAFLLQHVSYVASRRHVMRVLVHESRALPREKRKAVRRIKERYYEIVRRIVAELYEADSTKTAAALRLEHVTYALFGMVNWVYGWYEPVRHGPPVDVARSLHAFALAGLLGAGRRSARRRGDAEHPVAIAPPQPLGLRTAAR